MDFSNDISNGTDQCLREREHTITTGLSVSALMLTLFSSILFIAIIRRRRSNPSLEPFLLSIAIADVLLCLFTLPVAITFSVKSDNAQIDDSSVLCIMCAFSLLGLHDAKTWTYFTASIDGYLMVSSSKYRKHFDKEIKSSMAVLLWFSAGVFQFVLIAVDIGSHTYSCQLGLCVFHLTHLRMFIGVNSVNVLIVGMSFIISLVAIRKGRNKARKVAPAPTSRYANERREIIQPEVYVTDITDNIELIDCESEMDFSYNITKTLFPQEHNGPSTIPSQVQSNTCSIENPQPVPHCRSTKVSYIGGTSTYDVSDGLRLKVPVNVVLDDRKCLTGPYQHDIHLADCESNELKANGSCEQKSVTNVKGTCTIIDVKPHAVIGNIYHAYTDTLDNVGVPTSVGTHEINEDKDIMKKQSAVDVLSKQETVGFSEKRRDILPDVKNNSTRLVGWGNTPDESLLQCYSYVFAHTVSLVVFILGWGPFHVVTILQSVFGIPVPPEVRFALLWLGLCHGMLNVFVYPCFSTVLNRNCRILWKQFCIKAT